MKNDAQGHYGKLSRYQLRENDEYLWPEGSIPGPVCSWGTFRTIWNENFPQIMIRPKSEDTCDECFVFRNRFKYAGVKNTDEGEKEWWETGSLSSMESTQGMGPIKTCMTVDPDTEEREKLIDAVMEHVKMAKTQREYANELTRQASTIKLDLIKTVKKYVFVVDYCQNMGVPHFGEQQPGETYYFTPKSIYCLGIADVTGPKANINAYMYEEEVGKKGGNNVASLIMKTINGKK